MTSTQYEATSVGGEMTDGELEGRLIYAVIVAGKSANFADAACLRLWNSMDGRSPLLWVRNMIERERDTGHNYIAGWLKSAKTGNYTKIERFLRDFALRSVDLRTVKPQELQEFCGIGPKTSRFFITWTRPHERYAVLDRHILRYLATIYQAVPKNTPQTESSYLYWEKKFLDHADRLGIAPRELDYEIWCKATDRDQKHCLLENVGKGG